MCFCFIIYSYCKHIFLILWYLWEGSPEEIRIKFLFLIVVNVFWFMVFVGLGLLGSRKERKREVRCDFAQRLFLLLPLSVTLYTIERVLLSDAPSPLPLSPCSLSDPTSTSI